MDRFKNNSFLININLVFLIWVIILLYLTVQQKNEDQTPGMKKKYPGINLKEF